MLGQTYGDLYQQVISNYQKLVLLLVSDSVCVCGRDSMKGKREYYMN